MKKLNYLITLILFWGISLSCNAQTCCEKSSAETAASDKCVKAPISDKIEVLYFHYSRRCETCKAVEAETKKAVLELYGNKVTFAEYNLDEENGKKVGKELDISGQTLLILNGSEQINITTEGFMNARNNPGKLKQVIKEKIDALL